MNLELRLTRHLSHEKEDVYFNMRSCGIAFSNGRVLSVKIAPYDFWLFPGSRVEYMESSITTLEREVKEELNLPCKVVRLLWHVEDFYKFGDKETHEIGYYTISQN